MSPHKGFFTKKLLAALIFWKVLSVTIWMFPSQKICCPERLICFSNNLDVSLSENLLPRATNLFNNETVDNINNSIGVISESFAALENVPRPNLDINSNAILESLPNFDDVDHGGFSANVLQSNPTVLRDTHVSKSGRVSKRPDRLIDKLA